MTPFHTAVGRRWLIRSHDARSFGAVFASCSLRTLKRFYASLR